MELNDYVKEILVAINKELKGSYITNWNPGYLVVFKDKSIQILSREDKEIIVLFSNTIFPEYRKVIGLLNKKKEELSRKNIILIF